MKNKLLFLILLFHITAWFLLKPVWPFSDDYWYAFHAHNFLEGHLNLTYNQFQNRFGVYIPASFLFYFFGITPYTLALWPLLASCFTIAIVFLFLDKTANTTIAFVSSFLIATNTMQLTYSITIFPDLIVSFYCIAAVLVLYLGRQKDQKLMYPVLLNVILLLGFLTKETILLVMPFLFIVFVHDMYKKQNAVFWKKTVLLAVCSALLIFTFYYIITGDPFFRIRSMLVFNNNFHDEAFEAYMKTGFSSNILKWFNGELGYLFILIMSVFSFLLLRKKSINGFKFYITIYAIVLLSEFIFLFHTEKYGVLFMQDRLWILTIVPLSIVAAYLIFESKNEFYIFLIIIFMVLGLYNYYVVSLNRAVLFGLFLLSATGAYYLKHKNKNWNLLLLVPFLILSVNFVYSNSNYRVPALRSSNLIKNQIEQLNSSGKKIILTDSEFAENHIIYNGFKEYSNLTFYPFSKFDSLNKEPGLFVIINTERAVLPDFISKDINKWEKKYDFGKLLIYKKAE